MSDKIVTIGGAAHELFLERDGARFTAGERSVELLEMRAGEAVIRSGGRTHVVPFHVAGSEISFAFEGESYTADVADKGARARARHRDGSMSAPMPGLVLRVLAVPGAAVEKGAPLVILEAMKMEHTIVAPRDGRVVAIHCTEGELVQAGVELVELEAAAG